MDCEHYGKDREFICPKGISCKVEHKINTLDDYKIAQLEKMLQFEEQQDEKNQFGAHLTHWSGHGKPINIDAGALRVLIEYYKAKEV